MKSKKKIIITGGVGTGKSTVLSMFKQCLDDYIFSDMDVLIDHLYAHPDPMFVEFMIKHFGTTDKKQISQIVFKDKDKMGVLNSYLFSYVDDYLGKWLQGDNKNVMEFPLFFEMMEMAQKSVPLNNSCNDVYLNATIIVIRADQDIRIQRILERSKQTHPDWTYETVMNVLNNQMDSKIKEAKADYVIDNSGTVENTVGIIQTICKELMEKENA